MTLCPRCGRANSDEARFCSSCGATLTQAPPVKVEVKSPITGQPTMPPQPQPIYNPRQIQTIGSCYYHHDLPAAFVCSRCGRSICAGCNRQYGVLSFCPECYWALSPKFSSAQQQYPQPPYPMQNPYPPYYPPQQGGGPFF